MPERNSEEPPDGIDRRGPREPHDGGGSWIPRAGILPGEIDGRRKPGKPGKSR